MKDNEESEKEFEFKCRTCDYKTIWEDQLKQHMNWNHYNKKSRGMKRKSTNEKMQIPLKKTKIYELKCDMCNKVFNRCQTR